MSGCFYKYYILCSMNDLTCSECCCICATKEPAFISVTKVGTIFTLRCVCNNTVIECGQSRGYN